MENQKKDKISKNEIIIFLSILVVGVVLYFMLFGGMTGRQKLSAQNEQIAQDRLNQPGTPANQGFDTTEPTEEKTAYEWTTEDIVAYSPSGDSKLTVPGGDVMAQYQKQDNQNLYIRLELNEPINPTIVYNFFINYDDGSPKVLQIFASVDKIYFWKASGADAEQLDTNLIEKHMPLESNNIELKISYSGLGITPQQMQKSATRLSIVQHIGESQIEDTNQLSQGYIR